MNRRSILCRPIAVAALLGALVLSGCNTESFTFYGASREPFETPQGFEDVYFPTEDGLTLHGWFMPARGPAISGRGPAVLHAHGRDKNVSEHAPYSQFLTESGLHVLVFDYRDFGRSDRSPQPLERHLLLKDSAAALDYLRSREDVDTDRIGVYGHSLGAAFALALVSERADVRAVAGVSGFSTWKAVAGDWVPVLGSLSTPSGLDPVDSVAHLRRTPLLIVHGSADSIVPPYHAEAIADAAETAGVRCRKELIPGGHHIELIAESERARRIIAEFFVTELSRPR